MRDTQSSIALRPHLPIEHPIVDRFVEVHLLDVLAAVEVGDRAADAKHFVVSAGEQAERLIHAVANQLLAIVRQFAETAGFAGWSSGRYSASGCWRSGAV